MPLVWKPVDIKEEVCLTHSRAGYRRAKGDPVHSFIYVLTHHDFQIDMSWQNGLKGRKSDSQMTLTEL